MREIARIPLRSGEAMATIHLPDGRSRTRAVVLLNAGHVPRNGHGGLAVHLAERLREGGWTVIRPDLPGLGDAPGNLPERIETFWMDLKSGGHAPLAASVVDWARGHLGLRRVTLGGVCGAAITSIFTADRYPELVDSLLLIEPELFESEPPLDAAQVFPGVSGAKEAMSAASSLGASGPRASSPPHVGSATGGGPSWRIMRLLSGRRSSYKLVGQLQRGLLQLLCSRGKLPERANRQLIEAWARVASREMPSLVMTAEGLLWESYFTQSRDAIFGRDADAVRHLAVPGANHVFSNSAAKAAVLSTVPPWLELLG